MNKTYEPDRQFVERLEWQLASEFRRARQLKSSGKIALSRRLVTTAVMAAVLMTGVAVIKATEVIKDSWRKKIEMARMDTEVKLKKARLESTRELAARAETLFSQGLIREEEYRVMKRGEEKAGLDLDKSLLNLDEVKASGVPPRNELYAPLVGGRDFVSERLKIERKELESDLELRRSRWGRFKQMVEKGLMRDEPFGQIQAEIGAQEAMIDEILKRLDWRKRFLAGEIKAQEIEIMDRMAAAERDRYLAQSKVDSLKEQIERLRALEAKGMISQSEAGQLRTALDAAQAELRLAGLEIEILKKEK